MKYTILLNKRDDIRKVEAEEQNRFIHSILEALEFPIDWNFDGLLSVEDRMKFRKAMDHFDIDVVNDRSGGIKIYVQKEMIAEWKKCKFTLKRDHSEINHDKKDYVEMEVNFWSIFEEDK